MSQPAERMNAKPRLFNLECRLAVTNEEIEQALRLRYRVFALEEHNSILENEHGIEMDDYDEYCDHLIVKDTDTGCVIGTYRLLPGERALDHIGFYSETEFDLSLFERKRETLELGRSCIEPEYRGSRAIQMLWEGIAKYINERNYHLLIGCASLHFDNLSELNEIYTLLKRKEVITEKYGVSPLDTHKVIGLQFLERELSEKEVFRKLPPLMKGYQWLGAEIGGDPAYDPIFHTIDFFIVLEKDRVTRRYRKHFLDETEGSR